MRFLAPYGSTMTALHVVCAAALILSATAVSAKVRVPSDTDKLQAACYPDVKRLCRDAIPDEGKITACMQQQKSSISPGCLEAYEATQAD